jgi:hypothetical protein
MISRSARFPFERGFAVLRRPPTSLLRRLHHALRDVALTLQPRDALVAAGEVSGRGPRDPFGVQLGDADGESGPVRLLGERERAIGALDELLG